MSLNGLDTGVATSNLYTILQQDSRYSTFADEQSSDEVSGECALQAHALNEQPL